MNIQSLGQQESQFGSAGTLTWECSGKVTFGCSPYGEAQSKEGSDASFPKVVGRVKFMLEVVPTKFAAPLSFNLH